MPFASVTEKKKSLVMWVMRQIRFYFIMSTDSNLSNQGAFCFGLDFFLCDCLGFLFSSVGGFSYFVLFSNGAFPFTPAKRVFVRCSCSLFFFLLSLRTEINVTPANAEAVPVLEQCSGSLAGF